MASTDDDEDDYLNMTFEDPTSSKESSIQRAARLKKEGVERGRVPSKAVLAKQERKTRDEMLAKALDSSTVPKGAAMMAKMGFTGGALGKVDNARTRPIEVVMKHDRGGIGADAEKKRKIREEAEEIMGREKKKQETEEEFRQRHKEESEQRRSEALFWAAMRSLEGYEFAKATAHGKEQAKQSNEQRPLKDIPLLYRLIYKQSRDSAKEREARKAMEEGLARALSHSDDTGDVVVDDDDDDDDDIAFAIDAKEADDDEELENFQALPVAHRLKAVVDEMRNAYHYCFWCKYKYKDESMEGCPGLTEDEHG